ncbi:MAG: hypothetical protein GXO74_11245 [Calditrichaeota bacterium]|nr:hypothetical protein [Calditrichota bacterium]
MKTDYQQIEDVHELIMHLLSISFFYGDYAIPFHINNPSSTVSLTIKKNDIAALRKFAARNWLDFDLLEENKRQELEQTYARLNEQFGEKLKAEPMPLPTEFLLDLGQRAISQGKFRDAHSAFKTANQLDQRVNQFISDAIRILQSKEVTSGDASSEQLEEKCADVARLVFQAVHLKNPFGNQFQELGQRLHFEDADSWRKYNKYIEQSLFKEIIEFGVRFLIDDKAIADKIIHALGSGKVRRQILKQLAIQFSGGKERYEKFVENYRRAAEQVKNAKTEEEYIAVQKTLLGRGTGDNEYYQFLRELSLEHPVSALLVLTVQTSEGKLFIAPQILKSGESLLDFLDLG